MRKNYLLSFISIFLVSVTIAQSPPSPEFGIEKVLEINIQIYDDGFTKVEKNLILNQTTARIIIPQSSKDLSLTDSKGNTLGYELKEYGEEQILIIYLKSPQEKGIILSYSTSSLTRKNDSQWTFKFSSLSTARATIINMEFPIDTNITSLDSKEPIYIYPPQLKSPLFLYPQSNKVSLEINYDLPGSESKQNILIPLGLLFFMFLVIIIFLYIRKRKSIKPKREIVAEEEKINPSVMKMLDEQEKEIVNFLLNSTEEEITQAYIYKTLGIPKSSLSDIIRRLEQRDLIEKKKEGRVNWISLKEWVFK